MTVKACNRKGGTWDGKKKECLISETEQEMFKKGWEIILRRKNPSDIPALHHKGYRHIVKRVTLDGHIYYTLFEKDYKKAGK